MDRRSEPRVAVVLCTRDRPSLLREALRSLAGASRFEDEVVVVDSGSRRPDTRRIAASAGVRCVRCDRPGLSRARNAGLAATTAPIVAFVDDDCLVPAGFTASVERAFTEPRIGFVTGRVQPDRVEGIVLSVVVEPEPRVFANGDDITDAGTGANMAFRRAALAAIEGFDEALGAGGPFGSGEDKDAFWRILRAGWTGRYDPGVVLVHRQWRRLGARLRIAFNYGVGSAALAVKVTRLGEPSGRAMMRSALLDDTLVRAWRDLRNGYESGAVAGLVRAAGAVVGTARAWRRPITDGRFRA